MRRSKIFFRIEKEFEKSIYRFSISSYDLLRLKNIFIAVFVLCPIFLFCQVSSKADYKKEVSSDDKDDLSRDRAKRLEELKNASDLYAIGKTKLYKNEYLQAIDFHVGSIGGGAIRINGKGELYRWQTFNNLTEFHLPDSFFAIYCQTGGKKGVIRALDTKGKGIFKPMNSLVFSGEYPFANYYFEDNDIPVEVVMEAYSPFIPLDLKNSTLPVAIFNFYITNKSQEKQIFSLLQSQQNAVGYNPVQEYSEGSWNKEFIRLDGKVYLNSKRYPVKGVYYDNYGNNYNEIKFSKDKISSYLKANISKDSSFYGDMAIMMFGEGKFSAKSFWQKKTDLYNDFKDGSLSETNINNLKDINYSKEGETYNTAISLKFTLEPRERKKVTAIIAWHFPNGNNGGIINPKWKAKAWGGVDKNNNGWGGKGNYYSNHWRDAKEVMEYAYKNFNSNEEKTRLFHSAIYDMSLPHWFKDRLTSQLAILNSKTLFWTKDDYVGGWEGTGPGDGSCAGNCAHVWHYAQAHARLFPHLARRKTEQLFYYQGSKGNIPYRQPDNGSVSADAQLAAILQSYREHLLQTNDNWLKSNFSKINKAMEYAINLWDKDRDGRLSGSQHNTLDCSISGNSSWIGSMYAASLYACSKMANICGYPSLAKEYDNIAKNAIKSHNEELWNGQYYYQKPDEKSFSDYGTGSAIDQLLGQWWASQINLGKLYPSERISSAMESVFKYNFRSNFYGIRQHPREFVKDFQAGMQMITWPNRDRPNPHTTYADEVMTGFEYSAIATMLGQGLKEESFVALKAIYDRYDGRLYMGHKGDWGNWGFSGNPFGDDECGKMYSRSLSIWSILLAYQGFIYDGPNKTIGFNPPLEEKNHNSFFSSSQGWGVFEQNEKKYGIEVNIKTILGKLSIKKLILKAPRDKKIKKIRLKSSKQELKFSQKDNNIDIIFEDSILLEGKKGKRSLQLEMMF